MILNYAKINTMTFKNQMKSILGIYKDNKKVRNQYGAIKPVNQYN